MPPDPGPRPAEQVNAEMRALIVGGRLTDPEAYQRLLVEWVEAMRGGVKAA